MYMYVYDNGDVDFGGVGYQGLVFYYNSAWGLGLDAVHDTIYLASTRRRLSPS